MKGRLRMTATSDSWQVNDGQREGDREKELIYIEANMWLCLAGKTKSHTERANNLLWPLWHMTVYLCQDPCVCECV